VPRMHGDPSPATVVILRREAVQPPGPVTFLLVFELAGCHPLGAFTGRVAGEVLQVSGYSPPADAGRAWPAGQVKVMVEERTQRPDEGVHSVRTALTRCARKHAKLIF